MKTSCIGFLILFLQLFHLISTEKILFLFPLTSGSESRMVVPLVDNLVSKGHTVTFVSPIPSGLTHCENYTEIIPTRQMETSDYYPVTSKENILGHRKLYKNSFKWLLSFDINMVYRRCHEVYQNPAFQSVVNDTFDLVIISGQINNCFEGLIHKYQAPFIVIRVYTFTSDVYQFSGLKMPASFVPNPMLEISDRMMFSERVMNTLVRLLFSWTYGSYTAEPSQRIYREYLGQDYPDLIDIERNVSMIFSNSYFAVNFPMPLTPEIVEIGGMHCIPGRPLPTDLDGFLSDADDGLIFFSMGSMFKSSSLPPELMNAFVNILSGLKQKVLWTSDTQFPNMTSNILVKNFFPQQDLLAHPKIKLFITHGGIQSYLEAVYHAVPLLVIPIWAEQSSNAIHINTFGNGISLEVLNLNHKILERAIHKVLTYPRYRTKAKELSKIFKDQPQTPLERVTYWVEYVLRHKGAPQLRSAARDLNSLQYHSIDVILFLLVVLLLISYCLFKILPVLLTTVIETGEIIFKGPSINFNLSWNYDLKKAS